MFIVKSGVLAIAFYKSMKYLRRFSRAQTMTD